MTPGKTMMLAACFFSASAVALGAMAAHSLEGQLTERMLGVFQTAVRYQALHALALLVIGVFVYFKPEAPYWRLSATLLVLGIVLFSGSLYALVIGAPSVLGMVTPLGGLCFIAAWVSLILAIVKLK